MSILLVGLLKVVEGVEGFVYVDALVQRAKVDSDSVVVEDVDCGALNQFNDIYRVGKGGTPSWRSLTASSTGPLMRASRKVPSTSFAFRAAHLRLRISSASRATLPTVRLASLAS